MVQSGPEKNNLCTLPGELLSILPLNIFLRIILNSIFTKVSSLEFSCVLLMMAALKPFADDLEEQLTCSICQEIFTDPKTLPCLHNFCSKCIVGWYARSGNPASKRFDCPICRARIDVPDGDASKFRSSFNLKSLLQLLEAARAKSDQEQAELPECMSCGEHLKLIAFCLQCGGLICNECLHSHKRLKKVRQEHQVQLMADFQKENVESFVKSQMFCQEKFHERNRLEYYCKEETCRKCVCQKCVPLHHQNHDMLSIEEVAEMTKQAAKHDMGKLNQLKENYKQELVQSKINMARIENDIDVAKQKLGDVVQSIINTAIDHQTAMTNKLDGILSEQRKASEDEQRDIEAGMNELDEFLLRCETLLDNSAASEIAVSKDDLQQRCQSYLQRPCILTTDRNQRNGTLRYVTNQEVTESLQNVGRIVDRLADPLHSSIESMKEVRRGFVNNFVVMTRDSEDEVCHTDKGSIDVRIKDPEGNEVKRRFTEESTGKYRVSYRAEKRVQYEVQVNISGQPIRNSPQKVNTR